MRRGTRWPARVFIEASSFMGATNMRVNSTIAGGVLAAFLGVGAVTILPAFGQTGEPTPLDPEIAAALAFDSAITPSPEGQSAPIAPPNPVETRSPAADGATPTSITPPSTNTSTTTVLAASATVPTTISTTTTTPTATTALLPTTSSTTTTTSGAAATTTTAPSSPTTTVVVREDTITAAERSVRTRAATDKRTLNEEQFERLVATEIFRLTNCARTNNTVNWCQSGDDTNWNVTNVEQNPSGIALQPLERNEKLDADSKAWSEYLVSFTTIFHSDGSSVTYAENVAYNPSLHDAYTLNAETAAEMAATLMQQWMDSPGHRAQIFWPHYEVFGSGVEVDVSDPSPSTFVETWGTQRFQ